MVVSEGLLGKRFAAITLASLQRFGMMGVRTRSILSMRFLCMVKAIRKAKAGACVIRKYDAGQLPSLLVLQLVSL